MKKCFFGGGGGESVVNTCKFPFSQLHNVVLRTGENFLPDMHNTLHLHQVSLSFKNSFHKTNVPEFSDSFDCPQLHFLQLCYINQSINFIYSQKAPKAKL